MENIHKITPKKLIHSRGMVLITILLILLVISLLAASLLKTSLLAKKINTLNQDKTTAFDLAIKRLQQLEQEAGIHANTNIKPINTGLCGVDFYKITTTAKHNGTISKMQSIWAKLNSNYSTCAIKPEIRPGRQSFLIIK